jgi:hypothetical protein
VRGCGLRVDRDIALPARRMPLPTTSKHNRLVVLVRGQIRFYDMDLRLLGTHPLPAAGSGRAAMRWTPVPATSGSTRTAHLW